MGNGGHMVDGDGTPCRATGRISNESAPINAKNEN